MATKTQIVDNFRWNAKNTLNGERSFATSGGGSTAIDYTAGQATLTAPLGATATLTESLRGTLAETTVLLPLDTALDPLIASAYQAKITKFTITVRGVGYLQFRTEDASGTPGTAIAALAVDSPSSDLAVDLPIVFGTGSNANAKRLVAVAGDSTAFAFTDRTASPTNTYYALVGATDQFLALTDSTTLGNQIRSSTDGITWSGSGGIAGSYQWNGLAWGNGIYVAAALNGGSGTTMNRLAYSADGVTWTTVNIYPTITSTSSSSIGFRFAKFALNKFWVYGANGSASPVASSADGATWVVEDTLSNREYFDMEWNGVNTLVMVGTGYTAVSTDGGATWTEHAQAGLNMVKVVWNGTLFVAVGYTAGPVAAIWTSPDGVTWTARTTPTPTAYAFGTISYAPDGNLGILVAGYNSPARNAVAVSQDGGVTWSLVSTPSSRLFKSSVYKNRLFVLIGQEPVTSNTVNAGTLTVKSITATLTTTTIASATDELLLFALNAALRCRSSTYRVRAWQGNLDDVGCEPRLMGWLALAAVAGYQMGYLSQANALSLVQNLADTLLANVTATVSKWLPLSTGAGGSATAGVGYGTSETAQAYIACYLACRAMDETARCTSLATKIQAVDFSAALVSGAIGTGFDSAGVLLGTTHATYGGDLALLQVMRWMQAPNATALTATRTPPSKDGGGLRAEPAAQMFAELGTEASNADAWGVDWRAERREEQAAQAAIGAGVYGLAECQTLQSAGGTTDATLGLGGSVTPYASAVSSESPWMTCCYVPCVGSANTAALDTWVALAHVQNVLSQPLTGLAESTLWASGTTYTRSHYAVSALHQVWTVLGLWHARCAKSGAADLLFTTASGDPLTATALARLTPGRSLWPTYQAD
jgi:hypothetical protein